MKRRDFMLSLAATATWPIAAHAQRPAPPLIGVAAGFSEPEMRPLLDAFRERAAGPGLDRRRQRHDGCALRERAYTAGSGPRLDRQETGRDRHAGHRHAYGRSQGTDIPVVFTMVPDPVKLGIVDNLARPGGNITGFTNFEFSMGGKWLELLKELQPSLKRVLQISNPATRTTFSSPTDRRAGATFGLDISNRGGAQRRRDPAAITTFASSQRRGAGAARQPLVVNRKRISEDREQASDAGDVPVPCFLGGWRRCLLRAQFPGAFSAGRRLRRSHPQGREARRTAGPGADQIRADRQSQAAKAIGLTCHRCCSHAPTR